MTFLKRWFSRSAESQQASKAGDENLPIPSARRRNLENLSSEQGEKPVAEPKAAPARPAPSAAKKPSVAKKPSAATQAVTESISVVLRRQIPIRFDEEARSWIGGLPRMPVETEWPRVKPKKPLHFVAQVDCTSLPQELWGGLGPRDGWLLLFVDIEAIVEEKRRPIARVLHVTETGPEAAPPAGLYFARNSVFNLDRLPGAMPGVQRRHFRKWPVDLVIMAADTSELTGSELYGAPENDLGPFAQMRDRPMTWRGAYIILAELVEKHGADGFERNWVDHSGGLLDYPEPDASDFNKDWTERRQRLPEWGEMSPQLTEADSRLRAQMYEERRKGWTLRAFKVLDEETPKSLAHLDDYRAKLATALDQGDNSAAYVLQQSVDYFERKVADQQAHRAYLEELFAQYPSEEAFVAEINRVGRAHIEWAQRSQDRLRELLNQAGTMDPDAPITSGDWDGIAAQIASMKSVYWQKIYDTELLRKVERDISYASSLGHVVREEVLDRYASPPSSADGLDPDIVAELEPRLRNLECDRPHKLGGFVDSVYGDPLEKGHLLLFQTASDAATGWIWGDLGMIYVSIHPSDLKAGSFDKVEAWLEA
ncbi:DUF1963 domain-containing protein [Sphingomonas koreensis]